MDWDEPDRERLAAGLYTMEAAGLRAAAAMQELIDVLDAVTREHGDGTDGQL